MLLLESVKSDLQDLDQYQGPLDLVDPVGLDQEVQAVLGLEGEEEPELGVLEVQELVPWADYGLHAVALLSEGLEQPEPLLGHPGVQSHLW